LHSIAATRPGSACGGSAARLWIASKIVMAPGCPCGSIWQYRMLWNDVECHSVPISSSVYHMKSPDVYVSVREVLVMDFRRTVIAEGRVPEARY
jgi:hypothetical protein